MGQRQGTAVLLVLLILLIALGKAATPGGWWGLPQLGCGCWSRGGAARAGFGGSGQGPGPVLVCGGCWWGSPASSPCRCPVAFLWGLLAGCTPLFLSSV